MLSNLYLAASSRLSWANKQRQPHGASAPKLGTQLIAILLICSSGVLTGTAVGKGINLLGSDSKKPEPVVEAKAEAKAEVEAEAPAPAPVAPEPQILAAAAPAPVAVVAAPKPAPKPKPVVKAPVTTAAPILAPAPAQVAQPAARCAADQVMDDGKIYWLLEQSSKTLAANPAQAAGAARVDADLRSALGKNLCAAEAQALIARTCTDPAAVKFLNTMVSRLPFFIKPMVGNPCTADIVAVLNKVSRFMT